MRALLIIVAAVTACTLSLTAPAARAAPGPDDRAVVDVDFPGGTIGEYVQRIHRQVPDANIIVQTEALELPMHPVRLRQVDIKLALGLLNQIRMQTDQGEVRVDYGVEHSDVGSPVHQVVARVVSRGPRQHVSDNETTVLTVAEILDSGLTADDLLAALEVGLSLYGEQYEPLQIRFHEPTGIVVARGHSEQVSMLHELIASIGESAARRTEREQMEMRLMQAENRATGLAAELEQAAAQRDELRAERRELEVNVTMLREELARARTREHDLAQHVQRLDRELQQARTALDRAVGGAATPN